MRISAAWSSSRVVTPGETISPIWHNTSPSLAPETRRCSMSEADLSRVIKSSPYPGKNDIRSTGSINSDELPLIAVVDGQSLRHRFVRTHPCSDTLLAVVFPLDEGCTTEVTESLPLWLRIVHVVHTAVGRADASSRYAAERCLDRQVNIYGCGQAKVLLCQVPVQNKACLRLLGRQKRFDDNHVDILVAHKTPSIDLGRNLGRQLALPPKIPEVLTTRKGGHSPGLCDKRTLSALSRAR